jgi:prolyl oligopeptidase
MHHRRIWTLAIAWIILPAVLSARQATPAPPLTAAKPVIDTLHGIVLEDPYRWLEDQESPETRRWITLQNAYAESLLTHVPGREAIRSRLAELMTVDITGIPVERGGRFFFSRRLKTEDLFVICMRQGIDGTDEVLLDPHPLSTDHRTSIGLMTLTDDGSLLAYSVRTGGEDEVEVHLFDVNERKELPIVFPRARYAGFSILPDRSGIYYGLYTPEGPRLYYHAMGTPFEQDVLVMGKDMRPGQWISSWLSEDGRILAITTGEGSAPTKTELYLKDLEADGPITVVVNDIDARFSMTFAGGDLVIQTDWDAPNGRVFRTPLTQPGQDSWKEIIPESEGVIRGLSVAGGKLFVSTLENVLSQVRQYTLDGKLERELSFPSIGTVSGVRGNWTSDIAFYSFSSYHIPSTTYLFNVQTRTSRTWSRTEVPVESDAFVLTQVWYQSKDGTRIPMFLLHAKGLAMDGANPVYLTGYGGFNLAQTPGYSAAAVALAERGFVYAVPNLRGGGEFGERWHRAGMLALKQNVFDDFLGAAEWLIQKGYTRSSRLAIGGGSNGGLLVGAAMTQRPELFRAVVCSYPLLDMVRYHQFLVARFWVPEYGSSEDPDQFTFLHTYSPYHRVKSGTPYPAVLFITGDADTRVAPLHARKMAALVQAATSSDRPVLLKYDTKAGHSGGTPVSKQIDDLTDTMSFLLWQLEPEK